MSTLFTPKLYMKSTCPFCFKVMAFVGETGLTGKFEIITADGNNEEEMNRYRTLLVEQTGAPASFPTVEIAPGEFIADSDEIINYYADKYGIDKKKLFTLPYYLDGPFKQHIALFKENRALKTKLSA